MTGKQGSDAMPLSEASQIVLRKIKFGVAYLTTQKSHRDEPAGLVQCRFNRGMSYEARDCRTLSAVG
jgi:hypothetical protein